MRLSQEIKVGLLATTAVLIVYLGSSFLKGKTLFSSHNCYHTVYAHGNGLSTSSLVMFNGVPVGKIRELQIQPDQEHTILVTFETQKHIKLTDATRTRIITPSLFGGKAIDIIFKEGELLKDHDTVPSEEEQSAGDTLMGSVFSGLGNVQHISPLVGKLVRNLITCTDRLNDVLATVEGTAGSLGQAVDRNREDFRVVRQNISEVSNVLADPQYGLQPLLIKLSQLMEGNEGSTVATLTGQLDGVLRSLSSVLGKLERGDSTLSKVLEDDSLYDNFNQTINSLNQLLIDFRLNPRRYVQISLLGGQQKGPKDK